MKILPVLDLLFPHCTNGWQTQLQVCQPHYHTLQNNIIICLPFDMNFNFTLLSCVAKGTKWNFSIVPIIRLPEVNFSSTIDQLSQTREKFGYILPIRQFSTLEHILLSQGPGRWYWYKYKTFFAYLKEKSCKTHLKTTLLIYILLREKMTKRDYVQKILRWLSWKTNKQSYQHTWSRHLIFSKQCQWKIASSL